MSILLSILGSHIVRVVEDELVNDEPAVVDMIVKEIELLIMKLENLIANKSPEISGLCKPVLDDIGKAAVNMTQAAGDAAVDSVTNNP